jgi:glycerol-3-phosphate dehydrogenase
MAESVLHKLADRFGPAKGDWTAAQPLPGGDVPDSDLKSYLDQIRDRYPWMDELLLRRYVHAYGTLRGRYEITWTS